MMHPYDGAYLQEVAETQGTIFERLQDAQPTADGFDFIRTYLKSETRAFIDRGDVYLATLGPEGLMSYYQAEDGCPLKPGTPLRGYAPNWMGQFYSYYQWQNGLPSGEIVDCIPPEWLLSAYPCLHDLDLKVAVKKVADQISPVGAASLPHPTSPVDAISPSRPPDISKGPPPMTHWLQSRFHLPALFATLLALVALTPAEAEVFTETYTIQRCSKSDINLIIDTMIGPGVARQPNGSLIFQQDDCTQIGIFSNLVAKTLPTFANGVILATGSLTANGSLTNTTACKEWPSQMLDDNIGSGDSDLYNYMNEMHQTYPLLRNQAGIELYIRPKNKTLNIPFFFASEEYYYQTGKKPVSSRPLQTKYVNRADKFVVFLEKDAVVQSGKGMTNNIAQIPGGGIIDIATINQHTNTKYFCSNVVSNDVGNLLFPTNDIALPTEFNGAVTGLVAYAENLDTNEVYRIKIIIGDYYDNDINSAVYLRTKGITSGADLKIDVTGPSALSAPGPVTFTNTLSNVGPATADGVVVTNWLPKGVSASTVYFDVGTTNYFADSNGDYIVWDLGDRFKPGSNAVMRIDCDLTAAGSYTNRAHVITDTGDYEPANDTDDHIVKVGALPELTIDLISTNKCYGESMWLDPINYIAKIDGTNSTARLTGFTVSFTNAAGMVVDPAPTNAAAPVGIYYITLSNLSTEPDGVFGNRVTIKSGIFEVTNRCLTITASDTNKVYGTTISFTGTEFTTDPATLPNGEKITSVTLTSKTGAAGDAAASVDVYPGEIVPSDPQGEGGFDPANYDITFAPGTLAVTKATLAVSAPNIVKVYDGAGTNVTAAIDGGEPEGHTATYLYSTTEDGTYVEWQNLQYTNVVYDGASVTSNQVWYKVSTTPENYFAATNWAWVTITPRSLTVKAGDVVRKPGLGDTKPFAWSVDSATPIVAGEETAVYLSLTNDVGVSEKLDRTPAGEAPGDYTITTNAPFAAQTTGVLANYALAFTPGTLTITDKEPLTLYVANTNVVYGAADPTGSGPGFDLERAEPKTFLRDKVFGLDEVTFATDYHQFDPVGDAYTIFTNSTALRSDYYSITVAPGTLTVDPATLTIVASNAVKVYGTALTLTGSEFEPPVGLVNGETVTNVTLSCAQAATPEASVGDYTIALTSPLLGDHGFDSANYTLDPTNGTLTVTPATIATPAPGETPPAEPETAWTQAASIIKCYDGLGTNITPNANLPFGDTASYLFSTNQTGPFVAWQNLQFTNVVFDAEGNVSSNKVYYTITTDKSGAANYFAATNFAYVTITQRCVTVTAPYKKRKPGVANPTVEKSECTVTPAGEPLPGNTLDYSAAVDHPGADVPGQYPGEVKMTGERSQGNYSVTYSNGLFEITSKIALTIRVADTNVAYGAAVPTGLGWVAGDGRYVCEEEVDEEKIVGLNEVTFGTDYIPSAAVGSEHAITTNSADLSSTYYDITVAPGTLTVDPATLTIVASNAVKVYGTALTLTGSEFEPPVGLVNGETVTNVALTCAAAADKGASVGAYEIALGAPVLGDHGFDSANYTLDPTNGTLTVTPATIATLAPGETPPAEPETAWTQAASIIKCYDGLGTNITPNANLPFGDTASYLFSTNQTGPFAAWQNLQFTNVVFDAEGNVSSNKVYYTITTDKSGAENYFAATNFAYVTITQRCVTVTANSTNKVYGTTIDFTGIEFTTDPATLPNGETITSVTLSCDQAAMPDASVGDYPIVPSDPQGAGGFDTNNYAIVFSNGTLTVEKAELKVAAPDIVKCYDGLGTNIFSTVTGLVDAYDPTRLYSTNILTGAFVTWENIQFTNVVFEGGAVTSNQVWYTVTTKDGEHENYFTATNYAWVTITQRCVTVTAKSYERSPGDPNPTDETITNDCTVTGTLGGDTVAYSGTCTYAGEASGTHAGVIELTAEKSQGNYSVTTVNGDLTISAKVALKIFVASTNIVYGADVPTDLGWKAPAERYECAEPVVESKIPGLNDVTFATTYEKGDDVGAYTINTNSPALSSVYYDITVMPGTLTVTARCVTVKSESAKKVYDGAALSTNEIKVVAGSFADGEGAEGYGFATLTDVGKIANTFSVKPKAGTATVLGNYDIVSSNGTLEVTRAPILPVKPGEEPPADPTKAWTQAPYVVKCYDGLGTNICPTAGNIVPGNEETYLFSTNPAGPFVADLQFTNVTFDAKGNLMTNKVWYTVTTDKSGVENYFAATNCGFVVITQRCITVTANDATKRHGTELTFDGTEFVLTNGTLAAGETITSVTIASEKARSLDTAPGDYENEIAPGHPILGNIDTNNYLIAFTNGTLTVMPSSPIEITAASASKAYDGTPLTTNGYTYTQGVLVEGDVLSAVVEGAITDVGSVLNRVASYQVLRGATDVTHYYIIATVDGALTVTPRAITLTSATGSWTYDGHPHGTNVVTVTPGFVGDENFTYSDFASITDAGTCANTFDYAAKPGTTLGNYSVTKAEGTLTVTKVERSITIEAASAEKVYDGTILATNGYTHTQGVLVAGDVLTAVVAGAITNAGSVANVVASYRVMRGETDVTANYTFADSRNGRLTVEKLPLQIAADDVTKCYGETVELAGTEFTTDPETLPQGETITSVALSSARARAPETPVGVYPDDIAADHPVTGAGGFDTNNYAIVFAPGTLTVTQAVLTIAVEDKSWQVGEERPADGFADFGAQLVAGDTVADITGGAGLAADVTFTNAVWQSGKTPKNKDAGSYADEIWIDARSLDGPKAANYAIAIDPGDLAVVAAPVIFETTVNPTLNWDTGLLDFTMTVKNVGKGEGVVESDYWVQLADGPATNGATASVEKSHYLDSPTGQLPGGTNYVTLTESVKKALKETGNRDEVFDPGEVITVGGVSVYHWKRWRPELFIDLANFFVSGDLAAALLVNAVSSPRLTKVALCSATDAEGTPRPQSAALLVNAVSSPRLTSTTYDGILTLDGELAGTIRVAISKPNRRTGKSRLTATLRPVGEKRKTLYGYLAADDGVFSVTSKDGRELSLVFTDDGLAGSFGDYAVDGARNRYSSKTAADKAVVAAADALIGTYSIARPVDSDTASVPAADALKLKVARRGRVALTGKLAKGTRVSASSQMIIGEDVCCVPVICVKTNVSLVFCVWFTLGDGTSESPQITITGLDGATIE